VELTNDLRLTVGGVSVIDEPPVVLPGISPGSHTVVVQDTVTGRSAVFANVPFFAAGGIVFFHAVLE